MKKKLFALLLSLTLAAGLSACGGAPQSPGGQSSSTPEDRKSVV